MAMCVLPVNPSTLIYGTSDGGRTLHNRDETFSLKMEVCLVVVVVVVGMIESFFFFFFF